MLPNQNGGEPYMTVREMVSEIRQDVKALALRIEEIDRQGSIGTKEELRDHELRIRRNEKWVYGIPVGILASLGSLLAALFTNQPL